MAVALTTDWKSVASNTFAPGTGFSITFYLDAKYSTQSTVNNNTTIQTRLRSVINQGYGNGYNYSFTCSYAPTVSGSGLWTLATETITSGGETIAHEQDGTKTITLSASARITGIGMNVSFSGDATLPKINRYATLVSAPDFTDEGNPKITFTKNVATGAKVYAGIFNSTGTTAYASYRDISSYVSSGEYTFSLTTAERNALRNATPNANTMQVAFKMYTTISGTNFDGGNIVKTLSIVNANPTLTSPTYSEQNTKVSALLGTSGNTIVQNASTIRMGITATGLKGASVSKVVATHSGTTYTDTSGPYSFDIPIKTNSVSLVATDSRTNTGSFSKTWSGSNYIEYKPVAINSFSFKRQTQTGATILLNLDATYYQKTFGSTANVPIVKWKQGNGSWNTLTSSQYTVANNKLTISNLSLGNILPYTNGETFYIYIEDKLSSAQNSVQVLRGQATLELGKNDVKINGYVSGKLVVEKIKNKNLFNGQLEQGGYGTYGDKISNNDNYRNVVPVKVKPNTSYTTSIDGVAQQYVMVYYDINKKLLSIADNRTGTFTTPDNCYYVNFRCYVANYTTDFANLKVQLEEGVVATEYTVYETYSSKDLANEDIIVGSIKSKNLFDKSSYYLYKGYIDGTGKLISNAANYCLIIPFDKIDTFTFSFATVSNRIRVAQYSSFTTTNNAQLTLLKESDANVSKLTFKTLSGCKYLYIAIGNNTSITNLSNTLNTTQLELGDLPTSYTPFQNLDGYDNYSTEEQRIGTWIDGKPLYRSVKSFTSASGGKDVLIDLSALSIQRIIKIDGLLGNDNNVKPLNFYFSGNSISTRYTNGTMYIFTSSSYGSLPGYLIIEYTKTTD